MSTDRFLITGALGCIGAWTARNLVREGVPTVVFDLGHDPHRLNLILTPDELAEVTFVHSDITELDALEQALDEHAITHIIHLAALQLPFVKANPPLGAQVNVVGTVNVFEAVARRKERIGRVVYASSAAVYDAADVGEPGAVVQHTTTGHPTSLYGVFKQANEGTARIYWQDLCWLLGTSVHKTAELHQYNRSHLPSCFHEKTHRSGNSREGKPMLNERTYTFLTNQAAK